VDCTTIAIFSRVAFRPVTTREWHARAAVRSSAGGRRDRQFGFKFFGA
jgi:hypothetical protein